MHKIDIYIERLLPKPLKPFKDIVWFIILFLTFDFIWKLAIRPAEDEAILMVFGKNLTSYTEGICLWTAKAVHTIVHSIFGYEDFTRDGTTLYFDREEKLNINIIWGCTGLKQLIMFVFIMIFYFGPIKKKLWFIPLSLIILAGINILRLAIISVIVKDPFPEWFIGINEWYNDRTWVNTAECHKQFYIDWFNVFHRDVFTWLYYDGVILLMWLLWEEKVNKPYQRLKNNFTKTNIAT